MTSEGLSGLAATDIPELGGGVASTRYENVLVGTKGQADTCRVNHQTYATPRESNLTSSHRLCGR